MHQHQNKFSLAVYAFFTLAALLILIDFVAPGKIISDEITNVQRERQTYYNAGGNYHYSYKVITKEREILVSEDFAALDLLNKEIEYSVSRIFSEVNWYKLASSGNKSFYSLRIASGLVFPLLTLIALFAAFRFKRNINTIVLILQILLILDLIYLMR